MQRTLSLDQVARVERYARRPLNLVTIGKLMQQREEIARNKPGVLLETARFMRSEIPLRLSHRLRDFYRLPHLTMSCEPFARTRELYLEAFDQLSSAAEIHNESDCAEFARRLNDQVELHREVVPLMEKAIRQLEEFCECQPELRDQLRVFWDQLFVTRIGTRVLAEHFLSCLSGSQSDGVVSECEIEPLVRSVARDLTTNSLDCYGTTPEIAFDVSSQGTAAQVIPGHLRYVVQEVMKNSIRATVEQHGENTPPVKVCIHEGTFDVLIKISDMGGGLSPEVEEQVFDYGFSTAPRDTASYGVMGGYGVGLPLSRLYARYFGGDLEIHHMYGHGCTVAIHMSRLGTTAEFDISSDSDVDYHMERRKSSRRSLRNGDYLVERRKNGRRLVSS